MNGHAKSKKKQPNVAMFETVMDEFYHNHLMQLLFEQEVIKCESNNNFKNGNNKNKSMNKNKRS